MIWLLLAINCVASADVLTPDQEKAQRRLYSYLNNEKYNPEVDISDNSVCFRKDGILYWVTFEENSPILYTFHRKAFKVGETPDTYKPKPATIAANAVNRAHKSVKLTVGEKKVDIAIEAYAATPEDFIKVFPQYLSVFNQVDYDFKKEYHKAIEAEKLAADKIEEETRKNLPPSELRGMIKGVSFRLLDTAGKETTPYDQPLRSFDARFIQPRLDFLPWKEKSDDFTLQIRVYRPDGKPVYLPGKKYTAQMPVTLEKSRKNQSIEFDQFGSEKEGFWKAGEYKFEVLEGGDIIYTNSFNIL